jgi:hypothetical protein
MREVSGRGDHFNLTYEHACPSFMHASLTVHMPILHEVKKLCFPEYQLVFLPVIESSSRFKTNRIPTASKRMSLPSF